MEKMISTLEKCEERIRRSLSGNATYLRLQALGPEALLPELEQETARQPKHYESRLWWVIAQLELSQVPVSALSAPLDTLVEEFRREPELAPLAGLTFVALASALAKRDNIRLSIIMISRALEFLTVAGDGLNREARDVLDAAEQELQEEERRVSILPHQSDYREWLVEQGKHFSGLRKAIVERERQRGLASVIEKPGIDKSVFEKPGTENDDNYGAVTRRGASFDSRSLLLEAAPRGVESPRGFELPRGVELSAQVKDIADKVQGVESTTEQYPKILIVALLGLLCASASYYFFVYPKTPDVSELKERMQIARSAEKDIPLPQVLPKTTEEKTISASDFITEITRMKDKLQDKVQENNDKLDSSQGERKVMPEELKYEAGDVSDDRYLQEKGQRAGESQSYNGGGSDSLAEPPALSSSRLGNYQRESLGTTQGREASDYLKPQRQDSLPLQDNFDPDDLEGGRTLDGTPLRAYEVEKFPSPRLYRVTAATMVFTSPSLMSREGEQLPAGAKVQGSSIVGPWLEVRSVRGRRGYVRLQDMQLVAGEH